MHSLASMLEESSRKYADKTFLRFLDGDRLVNVDFSEFAGQVRDWAAALRSRGVQPGDRVGIITPKSPSQVRAFYSCWWLGAVAVPICESLGDLEMGFIIRDSEPKLILADATMADKVLANCGDTPVIEFTDLALSANAHADLTLYATEDDALAALIYTSGSTGMPKGVMLSHKNFHVNASSALETVQIRKDDVVISLLPYWHSFALVVEVVIAMLAGSLVIIPKDKRDFRRNMSLYRPTIILMVPRVAEALRTGIEKRIAETSPKVQQLFARAIYNASRICTAGPRLHGGLLRMAAHRAFYDKLVFRKIRQRFGGNVRFMVSGGAPLDIEHQIFFKYLGLPICQGYGLTESTPVISANSPEVHKLGSSGPMLSWLRPENGGDYTFLDEQGNVGKELKGELLVKGDCVMKGYWRHTDASAKTLADGWLHTGDMGYVDSDGFLFLQGRQGNMIVLVGGEKLHPEHIEDTIKTCELVTEAMVIGESCKNVYVCVNVDTDLVAGAAEGAALAKLRRQIAEKTGHLAAYQKPKDVLILPELTIDDGTLTVTLKVRRHKVWERHGDRIREFLRSCGEEIAAREQIGIESSRIMESLGGS